MENQEHATNASEFIAKVEAMYEELAQWIKEHHTEEGTMRGLVILASETPEGAETHIISGGSGTRLEQAKCIASLLTDKDTSEQVKLALLLAAKRNNEKNNGINIITL